MTLPNPNTYNGQDLGSGANTFTATIRLSCNNGIITQSNKNCTYSATNYPKAYNTDPSRPYGTEFIYMVSDGVPTYCTDVLGTGATGSYTTLPCKANTTLPEPNDNSWFSWNKRVVNMSNVWNHPDGSSCWNYRTNQSSPKTQVYLVKTITCTNNN